jgi:hypothetical protein
MDREAASVRGLFHSKPMSLVGTFLTWRDVWLESAICLKADIAESDIPIASAASLREAFESGAPVLDQPRRRISGPVQQRRRTPNVDQFNLPPARQWL